MSAPRSGPGPKANAITGKPGDAELAHYQDLVEQIPAVLYIDDVSHDYRTTYVGPQLEMLLGISPHDWCADPNVWSERMHPDDREAVVAEYADYLRIGTGTLIQEYRMIRPDNGEIVWIRDDCSLLRDKGGHPSIVQGVMFDITEQRILQEELSAAEAKNRALVAELRTVLETLTDGVLVFDRSGALVSRNAAASRPYELDEGPPASEVIAGWELLDEQGAPITLDEAPLATAMRTGLASEGTVIGMRKVMDGSVRWLSVSTAPVRAGDGEITGYVSCSRDLTERMETIRGLRILTAAAGRLGASLVPSEVVATLTEAASELCSSPGERPRRTEVMLVGPEDGRPSQEAIRDAGEPNAAMVPMRRDGEIFAILVVSGREDSAMSEDILTHLQTLAAMGALAYVNAQTHQQAALASRTDPLTGVGNRRALDERCAVLPRGPFVLVAMDVDDLKRVNDAHGHEVGDGLLTDVAAAMASTIRPSDILVRTGGDEFVALLVNCTLAGGAEAVARLRAAVAGVVFPWGHASVSFGCAAGGAGDSPQSVLADADEDLYRAKAIRKRRHPRERVARTPPGQTSQRTLPRALTPQP
jgi:diguanylate cyclase (GGDEF)-like protein/PAS domain S-box-containing protein